VFLSVITPTYNRQPILEKCLSALEAQDIPADSPISGYELLVVDDGSTDGTVAWLEQSAQRFPHVRLVQQDHQGITFARNLGVAEAKGDVVVFVDSDLIVNSGFLQAHGAALQASQQAQGCDRSFTYGRNVSTANFEDPTSEPYKLTDFSGAYFETNNVAIPRHWIIEAGWFDTQFNQYGWEDLELGMRLKKLGLTLVKCPEAVGYHYHPPFSLAEMPDLIDKEIQRARMGAVFYRKHPTLEVRMMIQMTWLHRILWGVLSVGGLLNERTLAPLLQWLIRRGQPQVSQELSRIFLNWYNVKAVYAAYDELQRSKALS
jgi:glycosyltransferase involved in cell wall biosynthesis